MAKILTDYLRDQAEIQFSYGLNDCGTLVVGWLDIKLSRHAIDVWRSNYNDEKSCSDFVSENGGFLSIADDFLSHHYGLTRTENHSIGNVALVRIRGIEMMAIRCASNSVAARTKSGIHISSSFEVVAEWG